MNLNRKTKEQLTGDLTSLDCLALSKAFEHGVPKDYKVLPGVYTGSIEARIDYTVTKADDTEAKPTGNLLSLGVIAKAMVLMGVQADNFIVALKAAAEQALKAKGDEVTDALTEDDKRVLVMMEKLNTDLLDTLPKQTRSGATKVSAEVTIIDKTPSAIREELAAKTGW